MLGFATAIDAKSALKNGISVQRTRFFGLFTAQPEGNTQKSAETPKQRHQAIRRNTQAKTHQAKTPTDLFSSSR